MKLLPAFFCWITEFPEIKRSVVVGVPTYVIKQWIVSSKESIEEYPKAIHRRNGGVKPGQMISREIICVQDHHPVPAALTVICLQDYHWRLIRLADERSDNIRQTVIDEFNAVSISF